LLEPWGAAAAAVPPAPVLPWAPPAPAVAAAAAPAVVVLLVGAVADESGPEPGPFPSLSSDLRYDTHTYDTSHRLITHIDHVATEYKV
jgi:hypothetical protein